MRTGEWNPFEEAWLWGDVDMTGNLDVSVVATARIEQNWRRTVLPHTSACVDLRLADFSFALQVIDKFCVRPLCIGTSVAGIGIELGVKLELEVAAAVEFEAELTLNYARELRAYGTQHAPSARLRAQSSPNCVRQARWQCTPKVISLGPACK